MLCILWFPAPTCTARAGSEAAGLNVWLASLLCLSCLRSVRCLIADFLQHVPDSNRVTVVCFVGACPVKNGGHCGRSYLMIPIFKRICCLRMSELKVSKAPAGMFLDFSTEGLRLLSSYLDHSVPRLMPVRFTIQIQDRRVQPTSAYCTIIFERMRRGEPNRQGTTGGLL